MPHLPPKIIRVRKWKNVDPEHFIQDIQNINWERFQLIPSVEDAWNYFYTEFVEIIDKLLGHQLKLRVDTYHGSKEISYTYSKTKR